MGPAVQKDLHRIRTGEDREPFHDGAGQEMGLIRLPDDVAAPGHLFSPSTEDAGASRLRSHAGAWERSNHVVRLLF